MASASGSFAKGKLRAGYHISSTDTLAVQKQSVCAEEEIEDDKKKKKQGHACRSVSQMRRPFDAVGSRY